jgi:hypothetical protein
MPTMFMMMVMVVMLMMLVMVLMCAALMFVLVMMMFVCHNFNIFFWLQNYDNYIATWLQSVFFYSFILFLSSFLLPLHHAKPTRM